MRPCLFSLLAFLLLAPPVLAQDDGEDDGPPEGLILLNERTEDALAWGQDTFGNTYSYPSSKKVRTFSVIGGPSGEKIDFFGSKLRPYLEDNPAALAEWKQYNGKRTGQVMGYVVAAGGFLVAGLTLEKTGGQHINAQTGQIEDTYRLTSAGIAGLVAAGVGFITAVSLGSSAKEHIPRAVNLYNANLLGETVTAARPTLRLAPHLQPGNTGLTLALRW